MDLILLHGYIRPEESGNFNLTKTSPMGTTEKEHGKPFAFPDTIDYQTEGIVSKRILQKEKGNITLFAFDTGQKLSEHTAPFDALVQVLEGTALIIIAGSENILKAGESIILPAGVIHAVNARTQFKMLLTMIRE
jgi:quercetin dioxygenase-like cupin family protein